MQLQFGFFAGVFAGQILMMGGWRPGLVVVLMYVGMAKLMSKLEAPRLAEEET